MDITHLPLDFAGLLALAAGLGWAAGLRLYTVIFVVGLAGYLEVVFLPPGLRLLQHPLVFGAAGLMLFIEFFADKIPWLDSAWDTVHTFIRIPAGAALAAMVFGGQGIEWQTAMAVLGGTLAAGTHFTKAGARAMINTSPEPFSNIAASIGEDLVVLGGLWLMFAHPWIMLGLLALVVALMLWLLPRLWRGIAGVVSRFALPRPTARGHS
ncbi:MAG: DUF4126 domain-containing protein [Rhodocyclales bacterium]|nr:DUF4126 domain-containing protein [Rhodocyclales bacterium]